MWFPWKEHGRTSNWWCPCSWQRGWDKILFKVTSSPKHSMSFVIFGAKPYGHRQELSPPMQKWRCRTPSSFQGDMEELEVCNGQEIFHPSAPGMSSAERGQLELLPECYRNKLAKLAAAEPSVVTLQNGHQLPPRQESSIVWWHLP